jgi:hypothetical protein
MTATSIGPPTVSIPRETFRLIDVRFTSASAIVASSGFGMNSTMSSIADFDCDRMSSNRFCCNSLTKASSASLALAFKALWSSSDISKLARI